MPEPHDSPVAGSTLFETERLVVRPWTHADADRHFDMYSRPEVVRWLGAAPTPVDSRDQSLARIDRWAAGAQRDSRYGVWAIEVAETRLLAGTVLLVPIPLTGEESARPPEEGGDIEVGWHLHPDSWGHGFATEAARGAIEKGFADGLHEIVAVVYTDNEPSLRVCGRLGMEATGRTRKWVGVEFESFRIRRPA
jgi:RimJ/RimL family protein N-acetyltransferase